MNFGDYNLEHKFHFYNQLLFSNKIPPCPVVWSDLKEEVGLTTYTSRGREIVPGTMKIEISTRYKRAEQDLDSTLIHEMIHALLAVSGYPKEKHGFRFQSIAYHCGKVTGITISLSDKRADLELAVERNVETTVLFCQDMRKKIWFGIFYDGTAFDNPKKQNELRAYWGRPHVLPPGFSNEVFVIKVLSSLMTKYHAARTINQKSWIGVSEKEAQDVFQHGKIMFKIVSGSVSHEEAAKSLPSKLTLVVLRTNIRNGEMTATFYMPNLGRDYASLQTIKNKWHQPEVRSYNVEIFFTNTTVFDRGFKMLRDPNKGTYYPVKSDTVEELRRNAQYIERWIQ
jgi:hypothetical protein